LRTSFIDGPSNDIDLTKCMVMEVDGNRLRGIPRKLQLGDVKEDNIL